MSKQKQTLGAWGEAIAAKYLEGLGYAILERNVRTAYGEIDLLASHEGVAVFVEVKTRSSKDFGFPEEAVHPTKQQHLLDSAEDYLQSHPEVTGDWRIDVISIQRGSGRTPEIVHFENAVHG